mmetsp:Transcript_28529/g.86060  ORF Transcript_28529/g.86060 Transcript_28529/m.86060 type:complete len:733 (+) Transcript_28529:787-2985(+)
MRCTGFGAARGDAAGRDVDMPRATRPRAERTKIRRIRREEARGAARSRKTQRVERACVSEHQVKISATFESGERDANPAAEKTTACWTPPCRRRGSVERSVSPAQAALEDFAPGHACWGLVPDRVPCRAPATLAVVARPPTLLWHDAAPDGMLERRAWRWDPESRGWGGLDKLTAKGIERRLCGAVEFADEFAGDDEAGRRAARKHRGGAGRRPIAVLKVAPGAASVAGDARRAADNAEGDAITAPAGGSPAGHSCSFYRTAKAARAACRALLRNEPQGSPAVQRGAAAVALQRYVAPKGPAAWMVRAVVDAGAASNVGKARDQGSAPVNLTPGPWAHGDATKPRPAPPRAWVFNEAHEPVCVSSQRCLGINGSAPPCSVVTSVPGSGAWRDAKAAAAALLGALNRTLPPSLSIQTLAADFVQDDRGSWWLLQIRGCRGRSSKFDLGKAWRGVVPAASPPPRPDDVAEAAGDASGPPCSGEWCDVEVPESEKHRYQDALARGLRFAVPRRALLDFPRDGDAPDVTARMAGMSKRERLALYDTIKCCANCHFIYSGPKRTRVDSREAAAAISAAVDGVVDAAADRPRPSPANAKSPNARSTDAISPDATLASATSPNAKSPPVLTSPVRTRDEEIEDLRRQIRELKGASPEKPIFEGPTLGAALDDMAALASEKQRSPDAAATLRAAMSDIDAIYGAASASMDVAMDAHFKNAASFLDDLDAAWEGAYNKGAG